MAYAWCATLMPQRPLGKRCAIPERSYPASKPIPGSDCWFPDCYSDCGGQCDASCAVGLTPVFTPTGSCHRAPSML